MASEGNGDLRDILRALARSEARVVVIGGFAMQLHGSSYLTLDLDIAYERTRKNAQLIAQALSPFDPRARGFPTDVPFRFGAQTILSSEVLTLTTSAGDVDLLGSVKGIGGYSAVAALSESITFEGSDIAVLSIGGLLQSKRAANRPKDAAGLVELEALLEARDLLHFHQTNELRVFAPAPHERIERLEEATMYIDRTMRILGRSADGSRIFGRSGGSVLSVSSDLFQNPPAVDEEVTLSASDGRFTLRPQHDARLEPEI